MLMNHNILAAQTDVIEYDLPTDSVLIAAHRTSEPRTFELPMSIWYAMFVCYAVFFSALLMVTGTDGGTVYVIAISIGYTAMYFGTAALLNSVSSPAPVANPYGDIDTFTGRIGFVAAAAQILTVPILVALFGVVTSIIYASVTP